MSVRFFVKAAAAVVALSTFVLLYFGLVDLARMAGVSGSLSWLYPLAIDGMVAAAYAATLKLAGRNLAFAWAVVFVGSAMSLVGQWLHAERVSAWDWAGPVAAAPALSMALVWHLLYLVTFKSDTEHAPELSHDDDETTPEHAGDTLDLFAGDNDDAPAPVSLSPVAAVSRVASAAPVARTMPAHDFTASRVNADTRARAVAVLSAARAEGRELTGADMARELGLHVRSGQRWLNRAADALTVAS